MCLFNRFLIVLLASLATCEVPGVVDDYGLAQMEPERVADPFMRESLIRDHLKKAAIDLSVQPEPEEHSVTLIRHATSPFKTTFSYIVPSEIRKRLTPGRLEWRSKPKESSQEARPEYDPGWQKILRYREDREKRIFLKKSFDFWDIKDANPEIDLRGRTEAETATQYLQILFEHLKEPPLILISSAERTRGTAEIASPPLFDEKGWGSPLNFVEVPSLRERMETPYIRDISISSAKSLQDHLLSHKKKLFQEEDGLSREDLVREQSIKMMTAHKLLIAAENKRPKAFYYQRRWQLEQKLGGHDEEKLRNRFWLEQQIKEIKELRNLRRTTREEIAKDFGFSGPASFEIAFGRTRGYLEQQSIKALSKDRDLSEEDKQQLSKKYSTPPTRDVLKLFAELDITENSPLTQKIQEYMKIWERWHGSGNAKFNNLGAHENRFKELIALHDFLGQEEPSKQQVDDEVGKRKAEIEKLREEFEQHQLKRSRILYEMVLLGNLVLKSDASPFINLQEKSPERIDQDSLKYGLVPGHELYKYLPGRKQEEDDPENQHHEVDLDWEKRNTFEEVKNLIRENPGRPIVIFCHSNSGIDLMSEFGVEIPGLSDLPNARPISFKLSLKGALSE